MRKHFAAAAAIAGLVVSTAGQAGNDYAFGFSGADPGNNVTLDSSALSFVSSGWYDQSGLNDPGNTNYIVSADFYGTAWNDFFVIDLGGIQGPISSASLTFNAYDVSAPQRVSFFDYTGSVSSLVDGTGGVAAFSDLGSGTVYGSRIFAESDSDSYVTVTLNAAALADINSAIANNQAQFVIGGSVVPEPETHALMLAGLAGVACAVRRRRPC
jgi:hypothetical protein